MLKGREEKSQVKRTDAHRHTQLQRQSHFKELLRSPPCDDGGAAPSQLLPPTSVKNNKIKAPSCLIFNFFLKLLPNCSYLQHAVYD